ncbi:Mannose-P-dolichol utilization defect 1 protein [Exaiptasia diaphana]|nr:Mannose-P-dolichol utilization defect 1 protein [Exaiptasia diaphana]
MAAEGYFFTPLVLLILPKKCHDEFFVKFNFFHAQCLKLAISKALGYGIVVGSSITYHHGKTAEREQDGNQAEEEELYPRVPEAARNWNPPKSSIPEIEVFLAAVI